MKKTIFTVVCIIAVFTVLLSCASSDRKIAQRDERARNASRHYREGEYYVYQFRRYVIDFGRGTRYGNVIIQTVEKPNWLPNEPPSEHDIDRAIAAYQASLRIEPSGTWHIVGVARRGGDANESPPRDGVQARLENAQRLKENWLTTQKPNITQFRERQQQSQQLTQQEQAQVLAIMRAADEHFIAKRYTQAAAEYERALNLGLLNTAETTSAENRRAAARRLGVTPFQNRRDYTDAIFDYTQVIQLSPNDAEAYRNRGFSRIVTGNIESGIADYNEVIRLGSNPNTNAHALAVEDLTAAARRNRNHAAEYNNHAANIYITRAQQHINQKNYPRAIEDATHAIRLNPNNAEGYIKRAMAHADQDNAQRNLNRGIEDATQAIRLDPNNIGYYIVRGIIYQNRQDTARAIADYQAAWRIDPLDPTVIMLLHNLNALPELPRQTQQPPQQQQRQTQPAQGSQTPQQQQQTPLPSHVRNQSGYWGGSQPVHTFVIEVTGYAMVRVEGGGIRYEWITRSFTFHRVTLSQAVEEAERRFAMDVPNARDINVIVISGRMSN